MSKEIVIIGGGQAAANATKIIKDNDKSYNVSIISNENYLPYERPPLSKQLLTNEKNIDPDRLKEAVKDDLLQEKLFLWLEENNTVTEKSSETHSPKNKKKSVKKKTTTTNKEKKSSKSPKS